MADPPVLASRSCHIESYEFVAECVFESSEKKFNFLQSQDFALTRPVDRRSLRAGRVRRRAIQSLRESGSAMADALRRNKTRDLATPMRGKSEGRAGNGRDLRRGISRRGANRRSIPSPFSPPRPSPRLAPRPRGGGRRGGGDNKEGSERYFEAGNSRCNLLPPLLNHFFTSPPPSLSLSLSLSLHRLSRPRRIFTDDIRSNITLHVMPAPWHSCAAPAF